MVEDVPEKEIKLSSAPASEPRSSVHSSASSEEIKSEPKAVTVPPRQAALSDGVESISSRSAASSARSEIKAGSPTTASASARLSPTTMQASSPVGGVQRRDGGVVRKK